MAAKMALAQKDGPTGPQVLVCFSFYQWFFGCPLFEPYPDVFTPNKTKQHGSTWPTFAVAVVFFGSRCVAIVWVGWGWSVSVGLLVMFGWSN